MKNRVIILEDNEERKKFFFYSFPNAKITDSKDEFLKWVTEGFSMAFMDNDLGKKYTGTDISREMPPSDMNQGSVCVHSMNIIDNEKIASELQRKGYNVTIVPYRTLLRINKK